MRRLGDPTLLLLHKLPGGAKGSRRRHTDRSEEREEGVARDDATGAHDTQRSQTLRRRGETGEWNACQRTALRSEESLLADRQPRPHCTGDVVTMDRFSGDLLPAMAVWCRAQPCGQIFPSRWHKPSHRQEIHRGAQTRQMEMRIRVVEAPQNLVGHSRMPLLHHLQTVSPTCPASCSGQQTGTSKTQTSEGQRQTCHVPEQETGVNPEKGAQDTTQRRIVVGRESGAQVRMHNAKMVVRSDSRTIEEQQPCTLEILDMGDLVHQSIVFDGQLRQLSAHIVRVSQRRPQDSDPLL